MAIEKWLVNGPKVIDLELVRSVKISLVGGKIDVIGHDEPGARVEIHSVSGKDLKVSIDGDVLEIDHPQLRWDNFIDSFRSFRGSAKADVSVLVPRDAALKFGVVSASGLISGLRTDARINSISGDIVVDDIVGDLDLNSVNGELSVSDQQGALTAHTVTGDVTVTGELRKVMTDGVSAKVFLDLTGTPGEIGNNTVSGDLTIRLDDGVPARYSLNTVSGKIQVDGAVTAGTLGRGFSLKTGDPDAAGTEIRANSVSGKITAMHRAPAGSSSATTSAATSPVEDEAVHDAPVSDAATTDAPEPVAQNENGESL